MNNTNKDEIIAAVNELKENIRDEIKTIYGHGGKAALSYLRIRFHERPFLNYRGSQLVKLYKSTLAARRKDSSVSEYPYKFWIVMAFMKNISQESSRAILYSMERVH